MTDTVKFRRPLGRVDLERMNLPEDLWTVKVQGVSEKARTQTENYLRNIDQAVGQAHEGFQPLLDIRHDDQVIHDRVG